MATPLKTRPAEVRPDTEMVTETGEPIVAHIVKTEPGEDAAAKVLEARINGTPLEALCGHVWVPSRDPKQVPMCQKCKDIYETYRMFNDGLGERATFRYRAQQPFEHTTLMRPVSSSKLMNVAPFALMGR